jgi:hypothetical protein
LAGNTSFSSRKTTFFAPAALPERFRNASGLFPGSSRAGDARAMNSVRGLVPTLKILKGNEIFSMAEVFFEEFNDCQIREVLFSFPLA